MIEIRQSGTSGPFWGHLRLHRAAVVSCRQDQDASLIHHRRFGEWTSETQRRRAALLLTATNLTPDAAKEISRALTVLVADMSPAMLLPTSMPEVGYASRNGSVGVCDHGLCGGFWRALIAESLPLRSHRLAFSSRTRGRATS